MTRQPAVAGLVILLILCVPSCVESIEGKGVVMSQFNGVFLEGVGDREWLQILEDCWLVLDGSGSLASLMKDCYLPKQDRFDEGPSWRYGFWTQNSYGMVAWVPLMPDSHLRALKRSLDLLYSAQGDGKTPDYHGFVAPVGAMPDAVSLDDDNNYFFHLRQGDCDFGQHDCMVESAAADLLFLSEYYLTTRDTAALCVSLRKMENIVSFLESRRDENNMFRVAAGGNLLAPSYAGSRLDDGSFSWGYHSGVQVTYCAALRRMIEVQKLLHREQKVAEYSAYLESALEALPKFFTKDGYLVNYIDQAGVRHGVYGAAQFGYMQATCNHDAIAFGVLDLETSRNCYKQLASVPGLWVDGLIRNNYPALDDTYHHWGATETDEYLWRFGVWVNGGVWGTNVARMLLAQFRLDEFADARKCLESFLGEFRNGIAPAIWKASEFPSSGRPNELDSYAVMGAALRGLWDCQYDAESLSLHPHVPAEITHLKQKQPIRFGSAQVFIELFNEGDKLISVTLNGEPWDAQLPIVLPFKQLKQGANSLVIRMGV